MQESIFQAKVRDVSFLGQGVVDHPDGRVFFVRGVWPGDVGRFAVTSSKKRYGFAQVQEVLEPSPERVHSPCNHQGYQPGKCGGCPWMIASYSSQLEMKQKLVQNALKRAGQIFEDQSIKPILPSPSTLGYRSRAQFKTDGKKIGFLTNESHEIVSIQDCPVLSEPNRKTLTTLSEKLPQSEWKPSEGQEWNFIEIDEEMTDSEIRLNQRRTFSQGNLKQNEAMQSWLSHQLDQVQSRGTALELFCGSGNFTQVLSEKSFKKMIALEANSEALKQLQGLELSDVYAYPLDLYRPGAVKKVNRICPEADVLVLNPPRQGFKNLGSLVKSYKMLKHIFYISCDLESFSRELNELMDLGGKVVEIQPLDQFPHTPHVEVLAHIKMKV